MSTPNPTVPEFFTTAEAVYPAWLGGILLPLWALVGIFLAYGSVPYAIVVDPWRSCRKSLLEKNWAIWMATWVMHAILLITGFVCVWVLYLRGTVFLQYPRDLALLLLHVFTLTPILIFLFARMITVGQGAHELGIDGDFRKMLYCVSVIFWPMIPWSLIVAGDAYNFKYTTRFDMATLGPVVTISIIAMALHWLSFLTSRAVYATKVPFKPDIVSASIESETTEDTRVATRNASITNRPFSQYSSFSGSMPLFRVQGHEVAAHVTLVFAGALLTWSTMEQALGFTLGAVFLPLVFSILNRSTSNFVWLEFASVSAIVLFQMWWQTMMGFDVDVVTVPGNILLTLNEPAPDQLVQAVSPLSVKFFIWFAFACVLYSIVWTESVVLATYRRIRNAGARAVKGTMVDVGSGQIVSKTAEGAPMATAVSEVVPGEDEDD